MCGWGATAQVATTAIAQHHGAGEETLLGVLRQASVTCSGGAVMGAQGGAVDADKSSERRHQTSVVVLCQAAVSHLLT